MNSGKVTLQHMCQLLPKALKGGPKNKVKDGNGSLPGHPWEYLFNRKKTVFR
jgi:hypothetical protein